MPCPQGRPVGKEDSVLSIPSASDRPPSTPPRILAFLRRKTCDSVLVLSVVLTLCLALSGASKPAPGMARSIRAEMEFLASDTLQGRGSGTQDELVAAVYLASELRQIGIEPAGDHGGYIQDVSTEVNFRGAKAR